MSETWFVTSCRALLSFLHTDRTRRARSSRWRATRERSSAERIAAAAMSWPCSALMMSTAPQRIADTASSSVACSHTITHAIDGELIES